MIASIGGHALEERLYWINAETALRWRFGSRSPAVVEPMVKARRRAIDYLTILGLQARKRANILLRLEVAKKIDLFHVKHLLTVIAADLARL